MAKIKKKKVSKKKAVKKAKTGKKTKTLKAEKKLKPIGKVTHYFGKPGVAVVKFNKTYKLGSRLLFKGATTDFEQAPKSMQYNHKPIASAKKGQAVGLKVGKKVRAGDKVYEV